MAAPTFIQEAETVWNTATSPKTTGTFNVLSGDTLVAVGITSDQSGGLTISNNGAALTWTQQQSINVGNYCWASIWTTVMTADRTGLTVSFALTAGSPIFGGNVITFRGSDGIGASAKTNVTNGAPTLNLTTTQASSAIVVANGDWAAVDGTTRTWRTGAGALTEQTYFRDSAQYTVYIGYHADAGAVGTKAVGLSAPAGQTYSIIAVEVKGTAPAAPILVMPRTRV